MLQPRRVLRTIDGILKTHKTLRCKGSNRGSKTVPNLYKDAEIDVIRNVDISR